MKNDEPLSYEQIASWCAIYEALKEKLAIKTTPIIENLYQNISIKEE